jgi:hypothetical protein
MRKNEIFFIIKDVSSTLYLYIYCRMKIKTKMTNCT